MMAAPRELVEAAIAFARYRAAGDGQTRHVWVRTDARSGAQRVGVLLADVDPPWGGSPLLAAVVPPDADPEIVVRLT